MTCCTTEVSILPEMIVLELNVRNSCSIIKLIPPKRFLSRQISCCVSQTGYVRH